MKYSTCISIVMAAIDYMLEKNWQFQNLPNRILKITAKGFVLEKDESYNQKMIDKNSIFVSPSRLIAMLFELLETDKPVITEIIEQTPKYKLADPISYIGLVDYLDKMRINAGSIVATEKVIDLNYIRFKQMILQFKKYSISSHQEIFELGSANYKSLVNLKTMNPVIARRLERMYQVETLLTEYCKKKILQRPEADIFDADYVSYLEALDKVDLANHTITWDEFCKLIRIANLKEVAAQNEYWQYRQMDSSSPTLTVLGIEEIILPGYLTMHI